VDQGGFDVALHPKTVLVVDDDELVLALLEADLRQAGFAVRTAANGKEALAMVLGAPVDIVVSDVTMPEMDGLEFCERIRQSPEHVDIPFIFLTAHGGAGERIRGLRSGADEYIVKPVNAADLVARVEILYDRIQRKRSVSTLKGNLRDVGLCEVLQLFELSRKHGVLYLDAPTGKGELALGDGSLMNAVWNDLEGEDAVFQMVTLQEGEFRFLSKAVPSGNVVQPISFVLMEMARLTDELATVEGHIPASGAPLIVRGPYDGEDADAQAVHKAIAEGYTDCAAVQRALRISDVRLRLAIGKLVEGGCVTARGTTSAAAVEATVEAAGGKPAKLLVAFTDESALSRCLSLMGDVGSHPMQRSGLSDFSRLTVSSQVYDVVCLRGEKRFSFMWELALKTSEGALFLLATDADKEHAAFFSARAACLGKPVARVCLGVSLRSSTGVQVITTPEDVLHVLSALRPAAR
jgi:DNA-binding response OmpR family regulator